MFKLHLTEHEFSGPLDVLLTLIQDQKLSISEVSLSKVTEQYLEYLDRLEEKKPEEMVDFLVIAARLLLMKSRALLPLVFPEEEEGPDLAEQLRLYQMFVSASRALNQRWGTTARSYERLEPLHPLIHPVAPGNMTLASVHESMLQLVRRLKPPKPLPETHMDKTVSLKEKIDYIRRLISSKTSVHFSALLNDAHNKTEVIVSFLALLELVKQKALFVHQDTAFADIVLKRV